MRPLSLGSPGSPPGTDIAAAAAAAVPPPLAHACHPTGVVPLSQWGMPLGTKAVTMPPSSLQEGAKLPMPKSLAVLDSQRGGVSNPSDDVGSSCGQVRMVSIDPDLVGWEIHKVLIPPDWIGRATPPVPPRNGQPCHFLQRTANMFFLKSTTI